MNIIETVASALTDIGYPAEKLKTAQIRQISSEQYKQLNGYDIGFVFKQCEALLSQRDWPFSLIAFDWAFRVKKQYTRDTFDIFEHWLFEYVTDWYDCDDFCTHAFGELIAQYNDLIIKTHSWTNHPSFAVRRAIAVVLISPLNKNSCPIDAAIQASELLIFDRHDLVQKGYGWALKVLSKHAPEEVISYLKNRHQTMPRVAFRYALEKLDKHVRNELMLL
ncbi:DNA alkylation repair protein [Pseudoalteromonas luteoviolacea]|uniref:DNA alkylation repair protein n=1 Tax=Pseudoalteromonas luteoviolacea TaxID=43657 RepID=UPI00114DDBAA|nr:DNA alkylation repair protein [Pseudoalteromonas luteoviolacea]TQF70314.1 DNA alkylation repair protein [Pseudoalteromonas luteoviolacea]